MDVQSSQYSGIACLIRLRPSALCLIASISPLRCAKTQECTIKRERIFSAASNGLRLLPHGVMLFHTRSARSVPCGNGRWLIHKKDPVFDVVALRNPAKGALAIESPISLVFLVTTKRPWGRTFIAFAISPNERIGFHEGAAGYPYDSSRGKAAQRGTSGNIEHLL